MFEQLLTVLETHEEETGEVIFLFDQATQTDLIGNALTLTVKDGAVVDNSFLINGKPSLKRPTVNSGVTINFTSVLDLTKGVNKNWTIEWSQYDTVNPDNTYASELLLLVDGADNGIQAYWGNAGYGDRLILQNAPTNEGNKNLELWRPPQHRNQTLNKVVNYAIVNNKGNCTFFRNGVPQPVTNGANSIPVPAPETRQSYPVFRQFNNIRRIVIGQFSSGFVGTIGHSGNVRISNFARYTRPYTPQPF